MSGCYMVDNSLHTLHKVVCMPIVAVVHKKPYAEGQCNAFVGILEIMACAKAEDQIGQLFGKGGIIQIVLHEVKHFPYATLIFEKVLEIFADYLTADETIEVYISRHGCVRVEFDQDFHYCSGEVCHTPKELFDLLADDYRTYLEIELTKGKREVTEDDEREADALCKRHLERWKEEQE